MGATYTLGYLYATMVAVNLIGPNGILTFEPEEVPIIKMSQSAPPPLTNGSNDIPPKEAPPVNMTPSAPLPQDSSEIPQKGSNDIPQKGSNVANVANVAKAANVANVAKAAKVANVANVAKAANVANVAKAAKVANVRPNTPDATTDEDPQAGGKRILRQRGGDPSKDTMSDAALMIRSFFTTLRAPAMSLFIRDPNAATLEDVETKSPLYTGIGVGFWACLATISGQVISTSIAQVC